MHYVRRTSDTAHILFGIHDHCNPTGFGNDTCVFKIGKYQCLSCNIASYSKSMSKWAPGLQCIIWQVDCPQRCVVLGQEAYKLAMQLL